MARADTIIPVYGPKPVNCLHTWRLICVVRTMTITLGIAALIVGVALASTASDQDKRSAAQLAEQRGYKGVHVDEKSPERKDKVTLTDEEWKKRLTPEQYRILRNKGTEAAFCSRLNDVKKAGTFHCAGCDLPLFVTDAKFYSGTGWPSFFQPAAKDSVWTKSDWTYNMYRVEVLCARCDGHLGHVFPDGPENKTGLRYCINGESLKFVERK